MRSEGGRELALGCTRLARPVEALARVGGGGGWKGVDVVVGGGGRRWFQRPHSG